MARAASGHILTQLPHIVHFVVSTESISVRSSALQGHTLIQVPQRSHRSVEISRGITLLQDIFCVFFYLFEVIDILMIKQFFTHFFRL